MTRRGPARRDGQRYDERIDVGAALYGLVLGAVRRVPRDMSLTASSTMATLERTGPRRITELAAIEGVTQPSMTVLVSALERSALVERRKDPADKRVALVALTTEGREHLGARRRDGAEAMRRLVDKLPPEDLAVLAAAIPALGRLRQLDDEQWHGDPSIPTGRHAGELQ